MLQITTGSLGSRLARAQEATLEDNMTTDRRAASVAACLAVISWATCRAAEPLFRLSARDGQQVVPGKHGRAIRFGPKDMVRLPAVGRIDRRRGTV